MGRTASLSPVLLKALLNALSNALLMALLIAVGMTLGCGGKTTEPTGDGSTGPVTTSVPPGGTQLMVRTAEGVTVTVTFPPGAVVSPIDVTLTPQTPADGNWVSVVFAPEGLIFREPVLVEVTVPEAQTLGDQVLYWGERVDPILLPTVPDSGTRTVQTEIRMFGIPDEAFVFPSSPGVGTLGSFGSLGPLSPTAGGGNQMNAQAFTCQQILVQAQADFNQFINQQDYRSAIRSALSSAESLQLSSCVGVQDWVDMAADLACDRFQAVLDSATATSITDYGQFETTARQIIYWFGEVQQLNPSCPAAAVYLDVLDAEGDDFLNFYRPRLDALIANDAQAWTQLKLEAAHLFHVVGEAYSLAASDAGDLIRRKALEPTFDRMREIGYDMGRNHGWHYVLSRLTTTGFHAGRDIIGITPPRDCDDTYTPPRCTTPTPYGASYSDNDIFKDMQYCGTDLVMETVTTSGGVLALGVAGGGALPGVINDRLTLDCPTRGTLRFSGKLAAMTCWNDVEADNEIIIALNHRDVLTLRRSPGADDYFGGVPAEFDIVEAAMIVPDSGFVPTEGFQTELTIRRIRTQCATNLWGPREFTLLTATLVWKNPTLDVEITFPDEVEPGQAAPVDIRVGVVDQFGNTGYFADVDVDMSVTGGSAAQSSGTTDSQGYFRSSITPNASSPGGRQGSGMGLTGATASLTIDATATSFEGVTAQDQHTASVLDEGVATVVTANRRVSAGSGVLFTSSSDGDVYYETGQFASSASSNTPLTMEDGRGSGSASASGGITSNIKEEGSKLVEISAMLDATATAQGTGLSFGDRATGSGGSNSEVGFEVTGKPVPYTLTVSGDGSGSYNGTVSLPAVIGNLEFDDPGPIPTINQSGELDPGTYQFSVGIDVGVLATDGSSTGSANITFKLTLGTQTP